MLYECDGDNSQSSHNAYKVIYIFKYSIQLRALARTEQQAIKGHKMKSVK